MPLFNLFKGKPAVEKSTASFIQEHDHAGLLLTVELEKAVVDCKAKVERIAKECKAKNRKFRFVISYSLQPKQTLKFTEIMNLIYRMTDFGAFMDLQARKCTIPLMSSA